MDLERLGGVYFMPRLCCAHAATLREVTNGIIENQYLRSVLDPMYAFSPPRIQIFFSHTNFSLSFTILVLNLSIVHMPTIQLSAVKED